MRLWIFGPPGSGKSTLARSLAEALDIPAHHLDDHFFQPNWVIVESETFVARVRSLMDGEAWILDGNYSHAAPLLCQRATAALWLDFPFRITYPRVLKRTITRLLSQEEICNGNHESLAKIFSRDGMPTYALLKHRRNQRRFAEFWEHFNHKKERLTDHKRVYSDAMRFVNECRR